MTIGGLELPACQARPPNCFQSTTLNYNLCNTTCESRRHHFPVALNDQGTFVSIKGAHKGIFKLARRLALQGNMSVQFTPHVKAVR